MEKYITLFKTMSEYEAFRNSESYVEPNLSFIKDDDAVKYRPYIRTMRETYFTITSLVNGNEVSFTNTINYSLEKSEWKELTPGNTVIVNKNKSVRFKGTLNANSTSGIGTFNSTGNFNVSGNIMSLLYGDEFVDKTELKTTYQFFKLFYENNKIIDASQLVLPATTLTQYCYDSMFSGCTSLTTAPELPATTLRWYCYDSMFEGCTSLTTVPELPATTLTNNCYQYMFQGCTSLTTAPELAATTLANYCYRSMFSGCTSLTTAPELPATTLADYCYQSMFYDCTSLTTAPELPATTLANQCYEYMFSGCTSLTTAPELLANTLTYYCYTFMFSRCSNLNHITMLATDISASCCLDAWVSGVASTGTFIKNNDMTSLPTGTDGIPDGWTVQDSITWTECTNLTITANDVIGNKANTTIYYTATVNGVDYKGNPITGIVMTGTATSADFGPNTSKTETVERTITFEYLGATATTTITQGVWDNGAEYLTFEAIENSTFGLTRTASQYSLDNGATWTSLSAGTSTPTVNAGNKIMFKATNPTISSSYGIGTFSCTGKCNVSGNIMSMVYGDDFIGQTNLKGTYQFYKLFQNITKIVDASQLVLPATTLAERCYGNMFNSCTSLTKAPELPVTTLATYCYDSMFYGCTSLTTAPELPATTLAQYCYTRMFYGCSSLTTAPELPATTLVPYCYQYMFYNCTSLTTAPELPATTLTNNCYEYMFYGCSSLTTGPELPATTLVPYCYQYMFSSCSSLTTAPELPATTLANYCYRYMFDNCTLLTTAPELPATTLASSCYYRMFRNCSKLNEITMLATDISASNCLYNWVNDVASTGIFIKDYTMTSLPIGIDGIPSGWTVQDNATWTECTNLTITADDVSGRKVNTTIYYTATVNGVDDIGNPITGVVVTGTATSADFGQNTSETETVERTITFEYVGMTATTTITQGVWIDREYTINLNNQWQLSSEVGNPDSSLYDGVYESFSNKGKDSTAAIMYIDIEGYTDFKLYIRSHAEGNYDYVMVSQLDQTINNDTSYSNSTLVKAHTRGSQNSGTSLDSYQLVEFSGIDGASHRITIVYCKDGGSASGADRGYILIPLEKRVVPDEGYTPDEGYDETYSNQYLTFEAIEDSTFSLTRTTSQYSLDDGATWNSLSAGTSTPTVSAGNKIMFKATNPSISSNYGIGTFSSTGKFNVSGNIMSLLYGDDFVGQTGLRGTSQFFSLFKNANIVDASQLVLPATILVEKCYAGMFSNCTSLTVTPKLPATTLAQYCYYDMFRSCTSLITPPSRLPATTLTNYCYQYMFYNCTSLTTAPELPATTLAQYCYGSMFNACISLTTAPELPATTLTNYCYNSMFSGCSILTTAPELPATTLTERCYSNMFQGCTSLTVAPELPATTLAQYCYNGMFSGCTSLTTAPELAATTLTNYCYSSMFYGCSKLNKIMMLATDISASNCLNYWVNGVASTGTFIKNAAMTSLPTGTSGIPSGWTVQNYGNSGNDGNNGGFNNQYLTFEAIENSTFSLTRTTSQYSLDNGTTWRSLSAGTSTPTVSAGNKIMFKATNPSISSSYGIGTFSSTGKFNVSGNIMSLLYGDDFVGQTSLKGNYQFYNLFSNNTKIVDASQLVLPATTLTNYCYNNMFYGCTSLTTAPELPATTLTDYCYGYMFSRCTSLTTAPELPATTLVRYCYQYMFQACSNLNHITMLATNISAADCLKYWVSSVASTGTFIKNKAMTSLPYGSSGIPNGWTIQNYTS